MQNYTERCNGCMAVGCGICSPPPNKANQLGEATCLKAVSFCHNSHFFTAADKGSKGVCNVTIIPFAAVVSVLVVLILCFTGCLGYCGFTLQKQRKLKKMLKAKQELDQQQQHLQQGGGQAVTNIPQAGTDGEAVAAGTTPVALNV